MSQQLINFLSKLNSADSHQFVYVDPENIDNFGIRKQEEDWVSIGSLENLSFGFQSMSKAIESLIKGGIYTYKGKRINVNKKTLLEAWSEGNLVNEEFVAELEKDATYICELWAELAAEDFVMNVLPTLLG